MKLVDVLRSLSFTNPTRNFMQSNKAAAFVPDFVRGFIVLWRRRRRDVITLRRSCALLLRVKELLHHSHVLLQPFGLWGWGGKSDLWNATEKGRGTSRAKLTGGLIIQKVLYIRDVVSSRSTATWRLGFLLWMSQINKGCTNKCRDWHISLTINQIWHRPMGVIK